MNFEINNQFIRSLELQRHKIPYFSKYPFFLPAIRSLHDLKFHSKVTFIVGENGTGKSTILEAIATAYGFNPEGGTKNFNFSSIETHSELHNYIKLVKGIKKPKDGFFLRAESFYNVASNIDELDRDDEDGECIDIKNDKIIDNYGGVSLHEQSHGESFFSLFTSRFRGNGLYILDEPEAALSPTRQMSMLSRMHELVNQGSQFIIATHSPIIMSYPDSIIYEVKEEIQKAKYEETEHYQVMRNFLNSPKKMLDILLES